MPRREASGPRPARAKKRAQPPALSLRPPPPLPAAFAAPLADDVEETDAPAGEPRAEQMIERFVRGERPAPARFAEAVVATDTDNGADDLAAIIAQVCSRDCPTAPLRAYEW